MKILLYTREGEGHAGYEIRTKALHSFFMRKNINSQVLTFKSLHADIPEKNLSIAEKLFLNIRAYKALRTASPDVLILQRINYHLPAAILYWCIFRPKLVLDIDDWEASENSRDLFFCLNTSFAVTMMRMTAMISDYVVCSSFFLESFLRPYSKQIKRIPSGIEPVVFKSYSVKPDDAVTMIWAGSVEELHPETLAELKEVIVAFTALSLIHKRFVIAARGGLCGNLEKFIKGINSNEVELYINLANANIRRLLAEADIGILPLFTGSRFNMAKSPVKLFEYMAAGVIPLVSASGEAGFIIKNGENGFSAVSVPEMIERVLEIARMDKYSRNRIIEKSRISFNREFSLEKCGESWLEVVNLICR